MFEFCDSVNSTLYLPTRAQSGGCFFTLSGDLDMKKTRSFVILIIILNSFFACTPDQPPEKFINKVDEIREHWAPDKRIRVFNIDYKYENGKWNIHGETSVPEIHAAVSEAVSQMDEMRNAGFDFTLLPDPGFGDTITALVKVSVGNLKRHPGHSSELIDQVLMGMTLKLLMREDYWILVQTPSEYLGWITSGSISPKDSGEMKDWSVSSKSEVTVNYCQVHEKPSGISQVVSDLVLGCIVKNSGSRGNWIAVTLPDERMGYVRKNYLRNYVPSDNDKNIDRDALVAKAKSMLGIPYLWGGNSVKGLDCSGFTGNVFRHFGYQLPRDANMQVKLGEEIIPEEDYSNILAGDLMFFGSDKRITHVGICLGGSYFIHSSALVKINSLDDQDELFNAYRKRTLKKIKRVINN